MINGGPAYDALAVRMAAAREEEGPRPTADGTRLRAGLGVGSPARTPVNLEPDAAATNIDFELVVCDKPIVFKELP